MRIRDGMQPLQVEDFSAAYALELAAHAFPWPESVLRQSLQNAYRRFGQWQEGTLIAMVFFQCIEPEVELLNLAVAPAYQGRGIGRALLEAALAQFEAQHYQRCFLEVRASNTAAIALYERLGFNQMGVRAHYYPAKQGREDAYLYALDWITAWPLPNN